MQATLVAELFVGDSVAVNFVGDICDKLLDEQFLAQYGVQPLMHVALRFCAQHVALAIAITDDELKRPRVGVAVEREVPAASSQLPSAALSTQGGGDIALDPTTESGQALESFFQFELSLDQLVGVDSLGERAYVRFDHGSEPLAGRIYRSLRQLFLRQFHV